MGCGASSAKNVNDICIEPYNDPSLLKKPAQVEVAVLHQPVDSSTTPSSIIDAVPSTLCRASESSGGLRLTRTPVAAAAAVPRRSGAGRLGVPSPPGL